MNNVHFLAVKGFLSLTAKVSVEIELGEGDATKQKSVKRSAFSLNEGKAFSE